MEQPLGKNDTSGSPACDQCRMRKVRCNRQLPECSNCLKAGVACGFSNRGRRINHAKQLVNDFSSLAGRLDSIDESITKILQQSTSHAPTPPSTTSGIDSFADPEDIDLVYSHAGGGGSDREDGNLSRELFVGVHHVVDDYGGERFYGFTAALSLFEASKQTLGGLLDDDHCSTSETATTESSSSVLSVLSANNPSIRSELQAKYDSFPFEGRCRGPEFSGDGSPIASPPRPLLEASIDCFLHEINLDNPIFHEARLREAIQDHYSKDISEIDEALSLCFNNIILLTLGLKSRLSRLNRLNVHGMEDDILLSFLKNAHRAFQKFDRYFKPRLVNAQALVTLAMVAREYCEGQVFERLCQMACYVVKFMGLQQSHGLRSNTPDIDAERRNIFWAVYAMDKQRVFMTGQPCDIYLFDSDIQLRHSESGPAAQQFRLAYLHMMTLWEDIHMSLYSSRAARRGILHRHSQVLRLSNRFQNWATQHNQLLCKPVVEKASAMTNLRLELRYSFHVGHILIHRCHSQDSSKQQRINSARAALNIINELRAASPTITGVAVLGRLFRCYPMVPFHELHDRFIEAPKLETSNDINGLAKTIEALVVLQHPNLPSVYYARLHLGMVWCVEIAIIIRNALEPQQLNISTPLSARHGHSDTSPTAPSPGQYSSSKSSTSSQQPAFNPGFRSSFQQKQSFPSGKSAIQSETNFAVKRTAGTLTFDGTPLKLKQPPILFLGDTTQKNTSHDDVIAYVPRSHVPSQEPKEFSFLSDQSRPHSAQGANTPKSINIQPATSEHAIIFDPDIFNNFLPYNPTITEPWESDLSDAMMLDAYHMSSLS